jgi:hypothetical protein
MVMQMLTLHCDVVKHVMEPREAYGGGHGIKNDGLLVSRHKKCVGDRTSCILADLKNVMPCLASDCIPACSPAAGLQGCMHYNLFLRSAGMHVQCG